MCAGYPCGPRLYNQIPCEPEKNANHNYIALPLSAGDSNQDPICILEDNSLCSGKQAGFTRAEHPINCWPTIK